MNLDIATAVRFMRPALVAMVGMLAPGTKEFFLGQLMLQMLGQFQAPGGHPSFAAHAAGPALPIPPEQEWTPEGIKKWATAQADHPMYDEQVDGPDDAA